MILAALAVVIPLFSASVFGHCSRDLYTIVEGDTCDSISAAHNVSTYQLAVVNQKINPVCSNLVPGDTLCLGYQDQDCSTTYVVQEGDYCWKIAENFGFNYTQLLTNNPQVAGGLHSEFFDVANPDDYCYIYPGEVLCVADHTVVTPAPEGWTLPSTVHSDSTHTTQPATTDLSEEYAAATTIIVSTTQSAQPVETTQANTDNTDQGKTEENKKEKENKNENKEEDNNEDEGDEEEGDDYEEGDDEDDEDLPDCEE